MTNVRTLRPGRAPPTRPTNLIHQRLQVKRTISAAGYQQPRRRCHACGSSNIA
jgi:hypothetical protein